MREHSRGYLRPLFDIAIAVLGLVVMGLSTPQAAGLAQIAPANEQPSARQLRFVIAQAQMEHSGHGAMSGSDIYKIDSLIVASPWTRATPGGAKIGGGYLKITNAGASVDRLVGATVDLADHVEIHEMSMVGDVMKMRPLTNGLEIKPGQTVELKPGGFHMMFVDIKQPLKQGDTFKATLKFEKAGLLDVNFSVKAIGAVAGSSHEHH